MYSEGGLGVAVLAAIGVDGGGVAVELRLGLADEGMR
jgi:hypothetical protein